MYIHGCRVVGDSEESVSRQREIEGRHGQYMIKLDCRLQTGDRV